MGADDALRVEAAMRGVTVSPHRRSSPIRTRRNTRGCAAIPFPSAPVSDRSLS